MGSKFNEEIRERVVVINARRGSPLGSAAGISQGVVNAVGEFAEYSGVVSRTCPA